MFSVDSINNVNTLKDLTGSGRNFSSEQSINIDNKAITLNDTMLKGPASDKGINDKFTTGFHYPE